jgi:hypothetical protein
VTIVKVRDLIAAEEALEAAERDYQQFNGDPHQWSAFESLDRQGKRHLNIQPGHYERREMLLEKITARQNELRALRAAFVKGA